jgi:hypothetical protein
MEQYFSVVSKTSALRKRTDEKQRAETTEHHPYQRRPAQGKQDDKIAMLIPSSSELETDLTLCLLSFKA